MSDAPLGPDWWQGDDGLWRAPGAPVIAPVPAGERWVWPLIAIGVLLTVAAVGAAAYGVWVSRDDQPCAFSDGLLCRGHVSTPWYLTAMVLGVSAVLVFLSVFILRSRRTPV